MKPFHTVTSCVASLPEPNVDTDQIIPKQFLKLTSRSGFGQYLFHERRREGFLLEKCRILHAGDNFGCGSSREHAVWALQDYGFDVIMAPSFADIFYSNCIKNGVLPIRLLPGHSIHMTGRVSVDLDRQQITASGHTIPFDIEPHHRTTLLEGVDDIDRTLKYESQITAYEQDHSPSPIL